VAGIGFFHCISSKQADGIDTLPGKGGVYRWDLHDCVSCLNRRREAQQVHWSGLNWQSAIQTETLDYFNRIRLEQGDFE